MAKEKAKQSADKMQKRSSKRTRNHAKLGNTMSSVEDL
jgi:hypothetical protein